ncbi:EthD domain-containing protein [Crucibulum laeve]|uniref:EthD domain-containing protein n=1 Tax=Crucibulum laeve TaxID=68775 RepID=A0A5C3M4N3_9AGAR|nr:EthD domain-containing protein [Crucibulum laeve]
MTVHLTVLLKRKSGLTHEQFIEHWTTVHAPLLTSLKIFRESVIQYSQFHVLKKDSDEAAAIGAPMSDYDGTANFIVNKWEDFLAFGSSPEYKEKVAPDEAKFLDTTATKVMIGDYHVKYSQHESK